MKRETTTAQAERLCPLSMGIVYRLKIFLVAETRYRVPNNQSVKSAERKRVLQLELIKAVERARGAQRPLNQKELHQGQKVESQT